MVTDLLFRVACHGGSDEPLQIHLKRITDSAYTRKTLGGADIDGELIAPVIQESHDGECRRQIMRYLRECLSESNGKRWQRIYGGLALTEKLMQHGSPALVIEVAHGHHFDVVQKVSFLEHFDSAARGVADRRAQNTIRTKASEFLKTLVPQLQRASCEELPRDAPLNVPRDTASTCSKDTASQSNLTGSTTASSMGSNASPASSIPAPKSPHKGSKIDEAFSDLHEWMESGGYSSGASAPVTPRGESEAYDSDWEPIGKLPVQAKPNEKSPWTPKSNPSHDPADAFFTPLPAPAAPAPARGKFMMSL